MQFDNLCKYLAEKYPDKFASWLLGQPTTSVEVLKTELSLEPIRADSVTLLRTQSQILHLEFQVKALSGKPMPLRMLNYFVRLYWQYNLPVTQLLIWLQQTNNSAVFETQFRQGLTNYLWLLLAHIEKSDRISPFLRNVIALFKSQTNLQSDLAYQIIMVGTRHHRDYGQVENLNNAVSLLCNDLLIYTVISADGI